MKTKGGESVEYPGKTYDVATNLVKGPLSLYSRSPSE